MLKSRALPSQTKKSVLRVLHPRDNVFYIDLKLLVHDISINYFMNLFLKNVFSRGGFSVREVILPVLP